MPSPSAEAALAKARPHPVERWRDAWQMPFLLLLASCTGRSIYEDAERTVPLLKITASSKPPGIPFSSLVTQRSGGEILLSPLDTNLNPDPEQVDFDPVPFLPADSGAIIGWDGRAGTIVSCPNFLHRYFSISLLVFQVLEVAYLDRDAA